LGPFPYCDIVYDHFTLGPLLDHDVVYDYLVLGFILLVVFRV
jgi:hypothetical protein